MQSRLHDRETEHFKGITSACHASAIADHIMSAGHNLKWDHFEILPTDPKPTLNDNVSSEKLYLY